MQIPQIFIQIGTLLASTIPFGLIIILLINKHFSAHHSKLGKTTTICTNVIGNLTKDTLMVRTIYYDEFKIKCEDDKDYIKIENTESKEELLMEKTGLHKDQNLKLLATVINLCRFKKIHKIEQTIIDFFIKCGLNKHKIQNDYEILQEYEQNKSKKQTTVVAQNKESNEIFSFSKGNPKTILKKCTRIQINDKRIDLSYPKRRKIRKYIDRLNKNGQKVIALAYKGLPQKKLDHYSEEFAENDLVFLGLIGVTEPLNHEVIEPIENLKEAGIKVYITTKIKEKKAVAISKQLKIINPHYFESITGPFLEQLSDDSLKKKLSTKEKDFVFAELKKKDMERILHTLHEMGETVAVSDQTKKTDFKHIVEGVKKSRVIEQNFHKYANHAISCKIAELLLLITALIIRVPLPFTIISIVLLDILVNLILELSLRADTTDISPTSKEFQPKKRKILEKENLTYLIINGTAIGAIIITTFILNLIIYGWTPGESVSQTGNIFIKPTLITFTILVIIQILNAFNLQSKKRSLFKIGILRNPYLLLTSIISAMILYIYLNFDIFKITRGLTNITITEWQMILYFSIFILIFEEFRKFITRLMKKKNENS